MSLYNRGRLLATYHVALGRGGSGQKLRAGDNRVPEGIYPIVARNSQSAFHRSLRLGYPTSEQRFAARQMGADPGGDIMIHGIRNGFGWIGSLQSMIDWTRGCIAVTDAEMDQVWAAAPLGTTVEIDP